MYICCSCFVFIIFTVVHMFIYVLKLSMIGGNKEYLSIYLIKIMLRSEGETSDGVGMCLEIG